MTDPRWGEVEAYLEGVLGGSDPVLDAALSASRAAGLPEIQVSPGQGRLLGVLARAVGARRILEVGTLGGYSTIWLARALPDGGRMVTIESETRHADVARGNLARAGLLDRVHIRLGRAEAVLPELATTGDAPFDLVFLDSAKETYAEQFDAIRPLLRVGSLVVADNVVRDGAVSDVASTDARVRGVQRLIALVAGDSALQASAVQTVGSKGYDGMLLISVVGSTASPRHRPPTP